MKHFTLRALSIAENAPVAPDNDTGSRTVLPLPRTFKEALRVLSRERPEDTEKGDNSLVRLGESVNLGPVQLAGTLVGMRTFTCGPKTRVGCWSDSEIVVCCGTRFHRDATDDLCRSSTGTTSRS